MLDRADLRLQDAREGLGSLDGGVDMGFIDGVKAQYGDYLDLLLPLLRAGGVLAVDNVLMSGTVAEGHSDGAWTDPQIAGARELNRRLTRDHSTGGDGHPCWRRRARRGAQMSTGTMGRPRSRLCAARAAGRER